MRRRFTINDEGVLVDRHGYELGQVVGITIDVRDRGPLRGVGLSDVDVEGQQQQPPSPSGDVEIVWEHYVEVMEPRQTTLPPAERTLIRDALKVATAAECNRAIDGCKASAFHMGQNSRGKKYNKLSQILKGKRGIRTTREQIDLFLDIAEKAGVSTSGSSVDPARLAEAKRNVLTGWEFPGSRQAQEMATMSAAWLAQHGYRVEPDPDGRPTFVLGESA